MQGSLPHPFAGRIDEPAVYNRALSAAEIQAIYNAGSAGKCQEQFCTCVTIYTNDFENPVGPSGQPITEFKPRAARALRLGSLAATLTATTWDLLMIPLR